MSRTMPVTFLLSMARRWMAGVLMVPIAASASASPAAQAVPDLRFGVPSTVSPEAAGDLRLMYQALATMPRGGGKPVSPEDWDRANAPTEAFLEPIMVGRVAALGVTVRADRLAGVPVLRVLPAKPVPGSGPLIYLHGGAYTGLSAQSTRSNAALFAAASGREVISVDYTRAPRARWQMVTDQVIAVWKALLATGTPAGAIGLFGDSAGGGLAAGSIFKMRDMGLPLPGALYLMSPWTDITEAGDTKLTLAAADPIADVGALNWAAAAYAEPADQRNPYVSPVYGDYSKPFPPTLIQGGTHEALLSDFVREYQAIRGGGHDAILDLYEGMPHVFPLIAFDAPETRVAAARVAAFFDAHLKRSASIR